MGVPAHVGIACNAYADAVATAYLGNNDTEDASKVVRDAVRTRTCMCEKGGGRGHREEGDSGPTDVRAHVSERARVGVRTISKDGEAGIAHGRGGGTVVERSGGGQPEASME